MTDGEDEPSKGADATATTERQGDDSEPEPGSECPICVMFKEGGCKQPFDDFMDCGVEAEKGTKDYQECVQMFDAMRECMLRNPEVFGHLLQDVGAIVSPPAEGADGDVKSPQAEAVELGGADAAKKA